MTSQLRLESFGATHVGCVRTNNEDSYWVSPERNIWVVADGMGGHEKGEWAACEVTKAISQIVPSGDFNADCNALADAIHGANATIFQAGQKQGVQMGSTVVALYLSGAHFALFWVGDSRAYLLRGGTLHRLTSDHSQVQAMVDRGLIAPEDAASHPMAHVLARAVGAQAGLEVDVITDEAEPGDVFLLCSDGLTNRIPDEEIATILAAEGHRSALDRLIALTLERNAPDNVTAVIVGASEATRLVPLPTLGGAQP
ncbi:PP2C family protein-serine/threonine phosphatase [Novosphingobium terrae]|uniref:PP2C family protein-serine/threonine phosphatase n=1 Tax=Novosphingobium terrae TaxID=2726189 RepID=UPI0019807C85|nr:protein phosphatase 2C domain-containing protein [Novosphingobium terrae]